LWLAVFLCGLLTFLQPGFIVRRFVSTCGYFSARRFDECSCPAATLFSLRNNLVRIFIFRRTCMLGRLFHVPQPLAVCRWWAEVEWIRPLRRWI